MTDRGSARLPSWMLPLAVALAGAGYLLFDLQRWGGAPTWRAVLMACALSGMALIATVVLLMGACGLDRRVAITMVIISGGFLLIGLIGPLIQSANLVGLKLPLGTVLAGMPPLLLLGATMLMRSVRRPRDR